MTNFDDVTRNFTDGLNTITQFIPHLLNNLQGSDRGDIAFRKHKDDLTTGSGKQNISFGGMGASAFETSVENNITRHAKPFEDNWGTLLENTTNLLGWFTFAMAQRIFS